MASLDTYAIFFTFIQFPLSFLQLTIFLGLIIMNLSLLHVAGIVLSEVMACQANLFRSFGIIKLFPQ